MRRLTHALLLALVLLSVQVASIGHTHGGDSLPSGAQAAACDFCTGSHAGAAAPEITAVARHAPAPIILSAATTQQEQPLRPAGAHRSRAPPTFRSI
ncbi:MAG: hypothetical protein WD793_04330 [Steroidobacteraceae bacterium]